MGSGGRVKVRQKNKVTLNQLTAHEVADRVAKREVTAVEVTEACLRKIDEVDPLIRSFIRVDREGALWRAADLDRRLDEGERPGLLSGVPVALKDIFCVKGQEITCGSRILKGFISPYDATIVRKLREAGAVFLGQTNMDEFAMGSSTENSSYGPTRNPWDPERVPGGSSGGSAAALAADEAITSLGSDTGGSIRQPASLCGIAGMKPTYSRVSRYGLIAYASSLDQIGPFGKDVEDIALVLEVISGHDPLDSTSVSLEVPRFRDALVDDIKGMKLGVPRECFVEGMEAGVEKAFRAGLEKFQALGAEVIEIGLPRIPYSVACYYILSTAEASSNLARFDGVQYGIRSGEAEGLLDMYESTRRAGFGEEVKRRIILGTYVLSAGYYEAYYEKALKVRRLIKEDFDRVFSSCDCVVMPTSPCVAFEIGARMKDPLQMYLSDIFTISVNLAGLPAISIPGGFDERNLPVGLQIIGPPFSEEKILRTAYTFERNTDFYLRKPELKE